MISALFRSRQAREFGAPWPVSRSRASSAGSRGRSSCSSFDFCLVDGSDPDDVVKARLDLYVVFHVSYVILATHGMVETKNRSFLFSPPSFPSVNWLVDVGVRHKNGIDGSLRQTSVARARIRTWDLNLTKVPLCHRSSTSRVTRRCDRPARADTVGMPLFAFFSVISRNYVRGSDFLTSCTKTETTTTRFSCSASKTVFILYGKVFFFGLKKYSVGCLNSELSSPYWHESVHVHRSQVCLFLLSPTEWRRRTGVG